jgi:conjugative transposon TraK protein
MFSQLKNIDSAFSYVRGFTLVIILGCLGLCGFVLYKSYTLAAETQHTVYILANGQALEAFAADRQANIMVEARDHVRLFHEYFFTLDPDEKAIQTTVAKALYLADASAKKQYDNLQESGFYSSLIAGNISQALRIDTISVNTDQEPYYFTCRATQRIIRATSIVYRSLLTEGYLRNVHRSDNNTHGFLIERWRILQNNTLKTENR